MSANLNRIIFPVVIACLIMACGQHQGLDQYSYSETFNPAQNTVQNEFRFDGYTTYWHGTYQDWTRYGNLFKTTGSAAEDAIIRSRLDISGDLGIEGLSLQEGFVDALLKAPYRVLTQPAKDDLGKALQDSNVLVLADLNGSLGRELNSKYTGSNAARAMIDSHVDSSDRVNAFMLENGNRKLFVVAASKMEDGQKLAELLARTSALLRAYDLRRGWFGAQTFLNSVTCTPGHPLDVIGKGLNEGNSWFVFSGYMDFMTKDEMSRWMQKVNMPVVTDYGLASPYFPQLFGLKDYNGLQIQSLFTYKAWVDFAHAKGGYAFRQVFDTTADASHLAYDGYVAGATDPGQPQVATAANKIQIDADSLPFVGLTGNLESGAVPSMVLFTKKGEPFTQKELWEAILGHRAVAAIDKGVLMGPALYRNTLNLLQLDRVFLEEYFGDRVSIEATTRGYDLEVTIKNSYPHEVSGKLRLTLPPEIKLAEDTLSNLTVSAGETKVLHFTLAPTAAAMNQANPIALHFGWGATEKAALTMIDLPPAISVNRVLYGQTPSVKYPVTIHNFSADTSFPVTVQVIDSNNPAKPVFEATQTCSAGRGNFRDLNFDLKVPAGKYVVKVNALGVEYRSQLGVGNPSGTAKITEVDLNNDGIKEYVLENDSVRTTLLATGGRIIEYIVKSRKDNVLFKLWPEKPIDDKRAFRWREFYPYGGFEDFLGQPSIETSKEYHVEVLKSEGDYVQVKMSADYYGNKLEKIFTLYGNSPLVEIRYALTFKNPELHMIGPQPMLSLGKTHGPEDQYYFPEPSGISHYSMDPDKYYGRVFFLKEGWNAAYDTKENIAFAGAFPVDQPIFLHMWMNHPNNPGSHYFYAELQPWVRIFQKSTMYFTYYLWAQGGPWENGVKALRDRNLITIRK